MIDLLSIVLLVFIDDGKARAAGRISYTQLFTDGFDKRCFSGTHLAIKGEEPVFGISLQQLFCSAVKVTYIFYADRDHSMGY